MTGSDYDSAVFINCPFDGAYEPVFHATVFCVAECGFRARCALELEDSGQVRIEKILRIIAECRYGIHDRSRTELDPGSELPRFNMPFELGLFMGAQRFGSAKQKRKHCLVLDRERFRYQQFLSDIAGQDIRAHDSDPHLSITVVRNWLRTTARRDWIPGGTAICKRYDEFRADLPRLCEEFSLQSDALIFVDFSRIVSIWLQENA